MSLQLMPIDQATAQAFVRQYHRHHDAPRGDLWRHSIVDSVGVVQGVCIVGRPVARALDDGLTVEATRVCVRDDVPNGCSMLLGAARQQAIIQGYRRGLTTILDVESGSSLKASGWEFLWDFDPEHWDRPGRPRKSRPDEEHAKQVWGWGAWPQIETGIKMRPAELRAQLATQR